MNLGQHQILLSYGGAAGAPPATLHNTATGASVSSLQVSLSCTAGRNIIVAVHWYSDTTISSITCTGESNLTVHGSRLSDTGSGNNHLQVAYLANLTSGGTKTFTVTMSGVTDYLHIKVTEITGADAADFIEAIGTNTGAYPSTSATASATSTLANSILYLAAGSTYFGVSGTPDAEFTELSDSQVLAGWSWAGYDLDAGTAGTETGTVTMSEGDDWMAILVVMNPA